MHKVTLDFFQDELGQYGIAHSNSTDQGFYAFWDGIGIFHDVFEHWFEGKHKYFNGIFLHKNTQLKFS